MSEEAKAAAKATADLARAQELLGDEVDRNVVALQHVEPEIIRTVTAIEKAKEAAEVAATGFRGMWESFKTGLDQIKGNAGEIMGSIVNGLITGAGTMKEKLTELGGKAADWLGLSMAAALATVPVVGPFLATLGPSLAKGLKKIGSAIGGFFKKLFGKNKEEAREHAAEMAKIAKEAADAWKSAQDSAFGNIISAWESAKDAGVAAYTRIYEMAIKAGHTEEEAAVKAVSARKFAIRQALVAEGEKYARLAAFEAALLAVKEGNAAGAAEAAREGRRPDAGGVGRGDGRRRDRGLRLRRRRSMKDTAESTKNRDEGNCRSGGQSRKRNGRRKWQVLPRRSRRPWPAWVIGSRRKSPTSQPSVDIVVNHHTEYTHSGDTSGGRKWRYQRWRRWRRTGSTYSGRAIHERRTLSETIVGASWAGSHPAV